jgi:hypothetical protein
MRLSSRRSGFAWVVLLSLLGAALVAPVIEVGDLLEATLLHRHVACLAPKAPSHLESPPASGSFSPPTREQFLVVGQYLALGPSVIPGLVLEPLARLFAPRPAPLSLSNAGRLHTDRGPPEAV